MDRKKKIESIQIDDEMLNDPRMDDLLKKSIMEEADRIEKELNEDPSLQGVGASDDMFDLIKTRLQEQGIWEEDEEKEHKDNKKNTADTDIYSLLSKEDREALELGKKVKKKRKRKWKQWAAVAAVAAVVCSVGMSGEASRRWMLDAWDRIVLAVGMRVKTNYTDDNTKSTTKYCEEEQIAWKKIKEELGTPTLDFNYLPEGMDFADYNIFEDTKEAFVFYSYGEKIFSIKIFSGNKGETSYLQSDVDPSLLESIINDQEISIKIWDTTTKGIESYMADFKIQDSTFVISAAISFEEFEKIIKSMYII